MYRVRTLLFGAVCIGCFGFGNQVFALGEPCAADAHPSKTGICADYDDRATYDVSAAGCTAVAFIDMSCLPSPGVGVMVCALECSVPYPSGGSGSGTGGSGSGGWTWSGSGSGSGSGGAPFTGGSTGSGSGSGGGPFTGVGSGSGSGGGPIACPPGTTLDSGTCLPTGVGLSTGSVSTSFGSVFSFPHICFSGPVLCVLSTFLSWILTVLGIVTVISFVIAGLQYMLSLGDPKSVETAKAHMKWSIVGLIVALSGVIAILQIDSWLGV
ncbi:MAG: hypothetical protein KBC19_04700 [Candidatus Moranbacteria bacterium]|jgi:hypothetical protein|nr:hypothetical protein [Candidatus Moranbacteria bacterium]